MKMKKKKKNKRKRKKTNPLIFGVERKENPPTPPLLMPASKP